MQLSPCELDHRAYFSHSPGPRPPRKLLGLPPSPFRARVLAPASLAWAHSINMIPGGPGEVRQPRAGPRLALQRLNRISRQLPDPVHFLQAHLRKEMLRQHAVEDFPAFHWFPDKHHAPYVLSRKELQEVVGYWAATQYGLRQLDKGVPLSVLLLREMHQLLLRQGRGCETVSGEFRPFQNWVGAVHLEDAVFVPPPPYEILECMNSFVRFLNDDPTPALLKAALAHVQLETIHPFQDGNGRLGRLLINLILCTNQLLRKPLAAARLPLQAASATLLRTAQSGALGGGMGGVAGVLCRGRDRVGRARLGNKHSNALRPTNCDEKMPLSCVDRIKGVDILQDQSIN